MSFTRGFKFLNARWLIGTDAAKPATGAGAGYVPTLQADDTVKWAVGGAGELLVEDGAMELLFDDTTGDVLYEG